MRENVTVVTFVTPPRPLTKRRERARPAKPDLDAERVNPHALAVALELAGGSRSRLRFLPDGSVMVMNAGRVARLRTPVERNER
jgi:hypothetical protein